jgi:2-dehydropantoate 2-reductase
MTSDLEKMTYSIGELDGTVTERLPQVKAVLDLAGTCFITDNLTGIRWTKLLINAAYSGMSAALGCTYGDVLDNDKARLCAAYIADELIKVSRVLGIRLEEFQEVDLLQLEMKNGKADFPAKAEIHEQVWGPHRQVIASMLFDMRLGRKTEIDTINGAVCANGRKVGVPTPFNDKVVELVRAAEAEKRVNSMEMLTCFDELIAALG